MMAAHPQRGDAYRQEYYRGHAEDQAKGAGQRRPVTVPYRLLPAHDRHEGDELGSSPGIVERKWYAAGVGEVKSQDVKGSKEGFQLVR